MHQEITRLSCTGLVEGGENQQNPQSARRNNFPGEQISRRFLLFSENLSASNYLGAANHACNISDEGYLMPH